MTLVIPSPYTSPNHGGPRATTAGVVIHSTRGGSPTTQTEYDRTIAWFNNTAAQVSAHAVVGPNGQAAYPVDPANIAWHARSWNNTHLGIELCQSHLGDVLDPTIVDTAAKIVAGWCKTYNIPMVWGIPSGLVEHWEIGQVDGKTDIEAPFDRADFLARVKQYGGDLTDAQKKAVLDDLDMIWGESKADTIKLNPAESERAIHERVVAIKVALGING